MVTFNGSLGRLEHKCEESAYINGDGSVPGELAADGTWIRIYPHYSPAYGVEIAESKGGHGGADPVMLATIFDAANQPEDPYLRAADQRSGAWSIMTGVAANHSMRQDQPVRISDLLPDIALPDYPPMPTRQDPLPLP